MRSEDEGLPEIDGQEPAADWVHSLVGEARFLERCAAAGRIAYDLTSLRRAGEIPLVPIGELLDRLARRSGRDLSVVVKWSGLDGAPPSRPGFARSWGRLARGLGLDRDRALLQLQLSAVEHRRPGATGLTAAARSAPRDSGAARPDIERAIRLEVASWDAESILALRVAEAELAEAYDGDTP